MGDLEKRVTEAETRNKEAIKMANYNEQYSRKTNVKIMDVREDEAESEDGLREKAKNILKSQGAEVADHEILVIHQIPTKKKGTVKPVLIKMTNTSVKSCIMRKRKELKNAGHKVVDDVTNTKCWSY